MRLPEEGEGVPGRLGGGGEMGSCLTGEGGREGIGFVEEWVGVQWEETGDGGAGVGAAGKK